MVTARIQKHRDDDSLDIPWRSASESLPPDTATATVSPLRAIPYLERVLAAFLSIDDAKHGPQSDCPEYRLV